MNAGVLILLALLLMLGALALARRDGTFLAGMERALEQFARLVPRMVCALLAAGFVAKLIPSELIAGWLGADAGLRAILIAAAAGLIVPAGPAIAFSIAVVFARSGASVPALVAFITSWSVFAAHRVFIYEIPLLGASFLRLRLASAAAMPLLAGLLAMAAVWLTGWQGR
jgi:uncharacterized membrane protein YraQ (UPF0718 family)